MAHVRRTLSNRGAGLQRAQPCRAPARLCRMRALNVSTKPLAAPSKDLTADIMEAAIVLALKTRLKQWQDIRAEVDSDAFSLMEGRFRSMGIHGRGWRTPLELTAHSLEVDLGEMVVDYGALLWQQRISLKNAPRGSVRIVLDAKDLGNFVTHPIFRAIAETAIQGKPFMFDKDSVRFCHSAHGGEVLFEGVWDGNGQRYRVLMRTGSDKDKGEQLQVAARHVGPHDGQQTDLEGAQQVAIGMAHFFTHMAIDLQGIELKSPVLMLHKGQEGGSELLDIGMKLRIRSFPPLDMKF